MTPEPNDHPLPDDERLLTVQQAAALLRISRSGLYRLMQRGELPSVHLGRAVRLRASDVQAFIRGRRSSPMWKAEPER